MLQLTLTIFRAGQPQCKVYIGFLKIMVWLGLVSALVIRAGQPGLCKVSGFNSLCRLVG